jgi:hypothetical protein
MYAASCGIEVGEGVEMEDSSLWALDIHEQMLLFLFAVSALHFSPSLGTALLKFIVLKTSYPVHVNVFPSSSLVPVFRGAFVPPCQSPGREVTPHDRGTEDRGSCHTFSLNLQNTTTN